MVGSLFGWVFAKIYRLWLACVGHEAQEVLAIRQGAGTVWQIFNLVGRQHALFPECARTEADTSLIYT